MMKTYTFVLILVASFFAAGLLSGCKPSEEQIRYDHYNAERTLAKVCFDGTRIWSWQSRYWIGNWYFSEVSSPIDSVCSK